MSEEILGAKIHPMAAEFPLLDGDEFNQLVDSIDKHGIQTPILVLHNAVTTKSCEPHKRDRKADHARSTVGQVAAKRLDQLLGK